MRANGHYVVVLASALGMAAPCTVLAARPAADAAERLPELPLLPSLEIPKPAKADLEELDQRLANVCSADSATRDSAVRELLEVDAKLVPAIRFRLSASADASDREAMKKQLEKVRTLGHQQGNEESGDEKKRRGSGAADYLLMAKDHAEPRSKIWCALISVLAQSRMLSQIGTTPAVRGLIDVYVRYGEFLRVNTQHELQRLGDKAVAALIEARRHPAEKIAKWAERELDALGKAIPGEAVQTPDLAVLADVLRAYGRVRDPDATRIVVSFANSDRAQVREAARQAIALFGEVGAWQLRDSYESVVGKKPPRDWNWERTARELFAEFDRLRSAEVGTLFETGSAALAAGDLDAMKRAFDQVLTRVPEFSRREPLIRGYLQYARKHADDRSELAIDALRRVERLSAGSDTEHTAQSLRLTLEAEKLEQSGIADRALFKRALAVDAKNQRAGAALARLEHAAAHPNNDSRYVAAAAIGAVALSAIGWILLRRDSSA